MLLQHEPSIDILLVCTGIIDIVSGQIVYTVGHSAVGWPPLSVAG